MTAKELLAIIIRTIALLWSVIAFVLLVSHLIDSYTTPYDQIGAYHNSGMISAGINLICGLTLFFSANVIARTVHRS